MRDHSPQDARRKRRHERDEPQVYGDGNAADVACEQLRARRITELPEPSLWDSYVAKSDTDYSFFGQQRSRDGLFMHALEVELGVTPNLPLGAFVDAEQPNGAGFTYTRKRGCCFATPSRKRDVPIDIGIR